MDISTLLILIVELWIMFICWKIFLRTNIKGFFSLTLGALFFLLSYPFKGVTGTVLSITSEVLWGTGVILMVTIERHKLKELWETTYIIDWLLGRIPERYDFENRLLSLFEEALIIICSALLIILSVTDHFIFQGDLSKELSLLFAGLVLIVFGVMKAKFWGIRNK